MTAHLLAIADDGSVSAGTTGFLVVVALCVASYFLFRSMTKHLRRVPKQWDRPVDPTATAEAPQLPGDPGTPPRNDKPSRR